MSEHNVEDTNLPATSTTQEQLINDIESALRTETTENLITLRNQLLPTQVAYNINGDIKVFSFADIEKWFDESGVSISLNTFDRDRPIRFHHNGATSLDRFSNQRDAKISAFKHLELSNVKEYVLFIAKKHCELLPNTNDS
ncbi:hypothetical protein F7U66_01475 [Vibrio parahaemolyticus]|nr:hypothetical protein [Vibrio parahaemolyticus]